MFVSKDKTQIKSDNLKKWLAAVLLAGFAVRRWYGLQDVAFWYDVGCFKAWADATAYYGLNNMYHSGMFLDYPPGYMYVLWFTNLLQDLFRLDYNSVVYTFLIKLPPMIADLAGALLVYKMAKENLDEKWALFLSACYTFCPAFIYNSGVWGQIDSWYTLFMVLSLYFISKDDVIKASVIYAVALITKPQAFLFGPVLLFWVISKKDWKVFFKAVGTGLTSMYLLALPFSQSLNPLWLINLYKNTFNGYRYFTVNGYNTYMLAGLNWTGVDTVPGGSSINTVVILACFVFCAWAYFSAVNKGKIYTTALVFITVFFSFCTMMHERYMHPAILLSMLAFICTKEKVYFVVFLLSASANFLNVVASFISQYNGVEITEYIYMPISVLAVACAVVSVWASLRMARKEKSFSFTISVKKWLPVTVLCTVHAMFAFFRLGATTAPESFWQANQRGEWFVYRFEEPATVREIWSFSGMGDQYYPQGSNDIKIGCEFEILAVNSQGLWENMADLHHDYVFTWKKIDTDFYADSVMIRAKKDNQILSEIVFKNDKGEVIRGNIESAMDIGDNIYSPLNALNESHYVPTTQDDYFWSAYFDEIYHARTAYEQLEGYSIYETTHPPLGKTLISVGVALFGMNPFGWRCVGAACGVLMVFVMYLMAKELFKKEKTALITAFIFAFDFMHYTQTRIATVDSYVVLFVMLMFLFMIRWAKIPLGDKSLPQYFNLFMSGIAMGCAVSVKWNGAYSAIGLAIYFFVALWLKYKAHRDAGNKDGVVKTLAICLWCVLFFVIVPAVIYFASFAPVLYSEGVKQTMAEFISKQLHMFSYHSQLVAEHFFASPWYTWPVIIKPIWYAISRYGDMASSISAFGNPAVWLAMIPALLYMAYKSFKDKETAGVPVVLGYLGSFLPWVAITRLAFIYHYFPATVFGVLAIGYVINKLLESKKGEKAVYTYMAVVFVLFVVFFPVISGLPAKATYLDSLELLSTWYFN